MATLTIDGMKNGCSCHEKMRDVIQPLVARETCFLQQVGSGSWLSLSKNGLQRNCCTKNILAIATVADIVRVYLQICAKC